MLTAADTPSERVAGVALGADDYLARGVKRGVAEDRAGSDAVENQQRRPGFPGERHRCGNRE
jgi:hypothetical protein